MLELIFFPDDPAMNPSSIQRGSVGFSSLYSGEPTTVGWALPNDSARGNVSLYTPSIPSIPLSMKDAVPLLHELAGHGVSAREANRSGWVRKIGTVTYDSRPAPGAKINRDHLMHDYIAPIWDVIGVIHGICSCMLTLRSASLSLGMLRSSGSRAQQNGWSRIFFGLLVSLSSTSTSMWEFRSHEHISLALVRSRISWSSKLRKFCFPKDGETSQPCTTCGTTQAKAKSLHWAVVATTPHWLYRHWIRWRQGRSNIPLPMPLRLVPLNVHICGRVHIHW